MMEFLNVINPVIIIALVGILCSMVILPYALKKARSKEERSDITLVKNQHRLINTKEFDYNENKEKELQ